MKVNKIRGRLSVRSRATAALAGVAMLAGTSGVVASSASAKSGKGTIAFLLSGPDLYYQYGLKGAEVAAKKLGYTVKAYPNPNTSPSVELANVQNAIASGAVAIDGYSVGLSTETSTIAKAGAANVPIFLMYGYSPKYIHAKGVVGFEQVPLVPYGQGVGALLLRKLKPGSTVGVITGQLGRGDAEGYRTGFLKGLGCHGNLTAGLPPMTCAKGIKYVVTETGKWLRPAAYTAAQDIVGKYPNLTAMYVENDDMAVGVHTALVAAHKNVQLVTSNGAPYGLAGIRAGWITGSSTVSPSLEGLYSVRLINAYLNKKIKGGQLYNSYSVVVDKATIGKAVSWTLFNDAAGINKWMNAPLLKPTK